MLECSKRAENIINRKVTIFYIETVLNFFFQLRKIIFLRSIEKKVQKFQWFPIEKQWDLSKYLQLLLDFVFPKKNIANYTDVKV